MDQTWYSTTYLHLIKYSYFLTLLLCSKLVTYCTMHLLLIFLKYDIVLKVFCCVTGHEWYVLLKHNETMFFFAVLVLLCECNQLCLLRNFLWFGTLLLTKRTVKNTIYVTIYYLYSCMYVVACPVRSDQSTNNPHTSLHTYARTYQKLQEKISTLHQMANRPAD